MTMLPRVTLPGTATPPPHTNAFSTTNRRDPDDRNSIAAPFFQYRYAAGDGTRGNACPVRAVE
jgi:hypothetical protein